MSERLGSPAIGIPRTSGLEAISCDTVEASLRSRQEHGQDLIDGKPVQYAKKNPCSRKIHVPFSNSDAQPGCTCSHGFRGNGMRQGCFFR